ncbi:MAG: lamin tail domain-containing protein [Myxococcota bacterium]
MVINEVDYDQPSTDTAEFVELLNAGSGPVVLDGVTLELVNGNNGLIYESIPLSGTLASGQYLVVASPGLTGIGAGAVVVPFPSGTDSFIQNGGPDGVALYDHTHHTLLDALSYEGSLTNAAVDGQTLSLVEGTATSVIDDVGATTPSRSLIRFPDGQDTGDAQADWAATTAVTPGAANMVPAEDCTNTLDDDVDGTVDCADDTCTFTEACGCYAETCDNNVDDDCDTLADCEDPDCDGLACGANGLMCISLACECESAVEVCGNTTDDDCDGLADCEDAGCDGQVCSDVNEVCISQVCQCAGSGPETSCGDTSDNDCDGAVDCADTDCDGLSCGLSGQTCGSLTCNCLTGSSETLCGDGTDDDCDGATDCEDDECNGQSCNAYGGLCALATAECLCPSGNTTEVSCTNTSDDDCDGLADCEDQDCDGLGCGDFGLVCSGLACTCPAGTSEVCDNTSDDDCDGVADCADPDCDGLACDANGSVCALATVECLCPGGTVEQDCTDVTDNDCDGAVDCADTDCDTVPICLVPTVSAVDYAVIAHGGQLVATGRKLTGATSVTVGGVAQVFTVDSDTQITVTALDDATPLGAQDLTVTTPNGTATPYNVTVIRLQINELDSDTPGVDAAEFVEISAGVPYVSLAGYSLIGWNGSTDVSYLAVDLNASTDANGLLLLGNTGVLPTPAITWPGNTLQNGQDAVGIYQAAASNFPNNTAVTASGLIDALVYETGDTDDPTLLDTLLGPTGTPGRVQLDEAATPGPSDAQSVQRCADGRRDGRRFSVLAPPSPGSANLAPPCP